ncbi:RNA-binding protein, partial [Phytophthora megakarya]
MADLDDEFARFEAEIQSLEQQEAKKDEPQPPVKKAKLQDARVNVSKPVVTAKPKVYMAPPRPAPLKKTLGVENGLDDRPRLLNTLED